MCFCGPQRKIVCFKLASVHTVFTVSLKMVSLLSGPVKQRCVTFSSPCVHMLQRFKYSNWMHFPLPRIHPHHYILKTRGNTWESYILLLDSHPCLIMHHYRLRTVGHFNQENSSLASSLSDTPTCIHYVSLNSSHLSEYEMMPASL